MYKKVLLDNGIPLVSFKSNDVRSVCVGIWVNTGSRHEDISNNGISHFLEHMFFKGTAERTSQAIAMESDNLGAELNAFTSSETTTFYIKALDQYLSHALGLLTDIFQGSTFPLQEIEKEKGIIAEEIKMVEDSPSDLVHDLFNRSVWGDEGLGLSVLGNIEVINGFTRDSLVKYRESKYAAGNIVVACSGNFDDNLLVSYLNKTIGRVHDSLKPEKSFSQKFNGKINIVSKDLSESHICLGLQGVSATSAERYKMYLLNTILGAGASSRLFQEVREKRGLVYSIYSYNATYYDNGLWGIYAGTDRKHVIDVIDITVNEIRNISDTVTDYELTKAKNQLKGNLTFALESTNSRMTSIARQEINYGRYYTPEEILGFVDAVTLDDLKFFAKKLIGGNPFALTVYGPVSERDFKAYEKILR
ncbi:MAG: insulinase family protein [Nitrospirae bacterium]|nr:insulinase family protein [Nitrospirota bacterium]